MTTPEEKMSRFTYETRVFGHLKPVPAPFWSVRPWRSRNKDVCSWGTEKCPVNTFQNKGVCSPCPGGTFQDQTGQTSCRPCDGDANHQLLSSFPTCSNTSRPAVLRRYLIRLPSDQNSSPCLRHGWLIVSSARYRGLITSGRFQLCHARDSSFFPRASFQRVKWPTSDVTRWRLDKGACWFELCFKIWFSRFVICFQSENDVACFFLYFSWPLTHLTAQWRDPTA